MITGRPSSGRQRLPSVLREARRRTFATLPTGLRIYAVGDVHGRADCLLEVFARIDADKRRFPVSESLEVYVGDYIDRGAESCRVVELMIRRRQEQACVHLLGNHETMLLASRQDRHAAKAWRRSGAIETLSSYGIASTKGGGAPEAWHDDLARFFAVLPPAHVAFLQSCPVSYACGSYFFSHAGIRPGIGVEEQAARDLLWIREPFLSSNADHGAIVVHGHTPVRTPEFRANRINLDTGAYATGHLSCVALEGNVSIAI